jgi:hypothetical protein
LEAALLHGIFPLQRADILKNVMSNPAGIFSFETLRLVFPLSTCIQRVSCGKKKFSWCFMLSKALSLRLYQSLGQCLALPQMSTCFGKSRGPGLYAPHKIVGKSLIDSATGVLSILEGASPLDEASTNGFKHLTSTLRSTFP